MDDSFFVGRGQSVRDLQRIVQSLAHDDRPAAQPFSQGLTIKQFRYDIRRTFARANVEYRQNIGMIQGRGSQRLLFETAEAVGIEGKCLR